MRALLAILVVLLGLLAVFALQNPGYVTVRFFHLYGVTSLPVVVILSFAGGLVAGFLGSMPSSFRARRRIRELESRSAGDGKDGKRPGDGIPSGPGSVP